jgi:hypothetical protein
MPSPPLLNLAVRGLFAFAIASIVALATAEPAMAIEQPKYSVLLKDGDFEVRRYAPYIVAEVLVSGDQGQAVQKGFRKLAGYIFGGNAGRANISMTAPVTQKPDGEKIAMTSPVTQSPAAEGRWTVQFMMPAAYTLNTLPKPVDPDIRFRLERARDMAVLKFSGVTRDRSYREKADDLRLWVLAKGLAVRGGAVLAQYDPPWTLWFLRRNEVLLEIVR